MSDASTDLLRLINGYWLSQAISVAASLGIADLLKHGARSSEELANATGGSDLVPATASPIQKEPVANVSLLDLLT